MKWIRLLIQVYPRLSELKNKSLMDSEQVLITCIILLIPATFILIPLCIFYVSCMCYLRQWDKWRLENITIECKGTVIDAYERTEMDARSTGPENVRVSKTVYKLSPSDGSVITYYYKAEFKHADILEARERVLGAWKENDANKGTPRGIDPELLVPLKQGSAIKYVVMHIPITAKEYAAFERPMEAMFHVNPFTSMDRVALVRKKRERPNCGEMC